MVRPTLIALASLFVLCPTSEAQVTLYEHADFYGTTRTFDRDIRDLRRSNFPNDSASSVSVEPGCTAWLYSDRDFQGRETVLGSGHRRQEASIADLGPTRVGNDRLSSLVVRCDDYRGGRVGHRQRRDTGSARYRGERSHNENRHFESSAAILFADAGFRGRAQALNHSIADLGRTSIGNDRLSSIQVAPGCRAILYEHIDFRGRSTVVRHDSAYLGRTGVGNDRASSIVIECR